MALRVRRAAFTALASTALAPALVPVLGATAASAATAVDFEVVADGLDNPRGSVVVDGDLYVVEAGSGGEGPCVEALGGQQACLGATGALTRVDLQTGDKSRVVEGLPNLWVEGEMEGTGEAVGPSDVAVTGDGRLLMTIGLGADPAVRGALGEEGALLGHLVMVDVEAGTVESVADLAGYEATANPDESDPPDSNPNALLVRDGEVLVADAGGNTVVSVAEDGTISTVAVFPSRPVTVPNLPPDFPMDPVPTSLAEGGEGRVLVGQLTGFPFPVGGANVYVLEPGTDAPAQPEVFSGGFTNVMDVVQRDDDTLVLELATNSLLSGPEAVGALARLRPDGTVQRLGMDTLRFPTGMTLDPDGDLYISNKGTSVDEGQVLRLDPSLAGDPAIQAACPPDDVAFPPFTDTAASVHEEAIACLWWWGITEGRTSAEFQPGMPLTRGQTASMLVRAAREAGVPLPTTAPDAFTDDEGSVHEEAINILAAADLLDGVGGGRVAPDQAVTRGQLSALMVRGVEMILGEELPAGTDAFTDDNGTTHEADINTAAAAGWVLGIRPGVFAPDQMVTRGQTASIMARALADLVEAGEATLPDPVSPQ